MADNPPPVRPRMAWVDSWATPIDESSDFLEVEKEEEEEEEEVVPLQGPFDDLAVYREEEEAVTAIDAFVSDKQKSRLSEEQKMKFLESVCNVCTTARERGLSAGLGRFCRRTDVARHIEHGAGDHGEGDAAAAQHLLPERLPAAPQGEAERALLRDDHARRGQHAAAAAAQPAGHQAPGEAAERRAGPDAFLHLPERPRPQESHGEGLQAGRVPGQVLLAGALREVPEDLAEDGPRPHLPPACDGRGARRGPALGLLSAGRDLPRPRQLAGGRPALRQLLLQNAEEAAGARRAGEAPGAARPPHGVLPPLRAHDRPLHLPVARKRLHGPVGGDVCHARHGEAAPARAPPAAARQQHPRVPRGGRGPQPRPPQPPLRPAPRRPRPQGAAGRGVPAALPPDGQLPPALAGAQGPGGADGEAAAGEPPPFSPPRSRPRLAARRPPHAPGSAFSAQANAGRCLLPDVLETLRFGKPQITAAALAVCGNVLGIMEKKAASLTALELVDVVKPLLDDEAAVVRESSMKLFKAAAERVLWRHKTQMWKKVRKILVPLYLRMSDETHSVAKASQEALMAAAELLWWDELKDVAHMEQTWRIRACLLQQDRDRVEKRLQQSRAYLEDPQASVREETVRFIGLAAEHLQDQSEEKLREIIGILQPMMHDAEPSVRVETSRTIQALLQHRKWLRRLRVPWNPLAALCCWPLRRRQRPKTEPQPQESPESSISEGTSKDPSPGQSRDK
ncbi:uncharacterized protein LOC121063234 isoform X1 [Cygnus olor]|uniref:uncharacterized protein LOC121063234 isoform X1 n=1 Tax=Cygnus olor TaxID=8869 RepID=UPI001ADDF5C3|nr:uncharacterized protein LOC121063234 isoform X1 [Cygnus olor]